MARAGVLVLASLLAVGMMGKPFAPAAPSESRITPHSVDVARQGIPETFHSLDDYFVENRGQVADGIRYYSLGNPSVAFRDDGVMFVIREAEKGNRRAAWPGPTDRVTAVETAATESFAFMLRYEGANKVTPTGVGRLSFNSNFYFGKNPSNWETGVPSYTEVGYRNLYDGIDLTFRATARGPKYEFQVRPGADLRRISVGYDGVGSLGLHAGELIISTAAGELRDSAPVAYQSGGPVACAFSLQSPRSHGFTCDGWDRSETLFLDPLLYSTFLGGSGSDEIDSIDVDGAGNAYVTGQTSSVNFPVTPGAFQPMSDGYPRPFVAKINSTGQRLVYATYFGGTDQSYEAGAAIAVDNSGNAYAAGAAGSSDFPTTPGAYDQTYNGFGDGWVAKFDPNGSLMYSTLVGGNNSDLVWGIAIDDVGNAYGVGITVSTDFPTTAGVIQQTPGGGDEGFAFKLDAAGAHLVYSTYLGGSVDDYAKSVTADDAGHAYVVGGTRSLDFPVTIGALDRTMDYLDAFVCELTPSGDRFVFSTFLGGSAEEVGSSIALDALGNIFVSGTTSSSDFPATSGAYDTTANGDLDAFVAKLNPSGSKLLYATYLGGSGMENGAVQTGPTLAPDSLGSVYVAGWTSSTDFPTTSDAERRTRTPGFMDAFVSKLDPSGGNLTYSTYLGGMAGAQYGYDVAVDAAGDAYVVGYTLSSDFPVTPRALGFMYRGNGDGFVTELTAGIPQALGDLAVFPSDIALSPLPPYDDGTTVLVNATIHNIGSNPTDNTTARFHDGVPPSPRIGLDQPLPSIPAAGTQNVSVSWTASLNGNHELCVVADPDNLTLETSKTNNMACVSVLVKSPAPEEPDHVPIQPQPTPPIRVGLSLPLSLSVVIRNQGNATAISDSWLAFFNDTTPAIPFSTFLVSPIDPGGDSRRFAAQWVSPATAGTYRVTADVDYYSSVTEWNESNNRYTWTIEVVAGPFTSLVIGVPDYISPAMVTFVKSSTPLTLLATDGGVGSNSTFYRLWGGSWFRWRDYSTSFNLAGRDGTWYVEFLSFDYLGNKEPVRNETLILDDTPPVTTISPAAPFTFTATDSGCGVNVTMYRIDGGSWTVYAGGFNLTEGEHTIYYYSVDKLGNFEPEKSLVIKSPVEVGVNYKPIVALVFAIILLVAGIWSSKRRPWKGGKDGKAVMKSFVLTTLPFVLVEAATGILSLSFEPLRIPPLIGWGTGVDCTLLAVGLLLSLIRSLWKRETNAENSRN